MPFFSSNTPSSVPAPPTPRLRLSSLGKLCVAIQAPSPEELIERADDALYAAKRGGGHSATAPRPELITVNLHNRFGGFRTHHLAHRYKPQWAGAVQPDGPVHRDLYQASHGEPFLGREQDSSAADVQRLPNSTGLQPFGMEHTVPDFLPDREAVGLPAISRASEIHA